MKLGIDLYLNRFSIGGVDLLASKGIYMRLNTWKQRWRLLKDWNQALLTFFIFDVGREQ